MSLAILELRKKADLVLKLFDYKLPQDLSRMIDQCIRPEIGDEYKGFNEGEHDHALYLDVDGNPFELEVRGVILPVDRGKSTLHDVQLDQSSGEMIYQVLNIRRPLFYMNHKTRLSPGSHRLRLRLFNVLNTLRARIAIIEAVPLHNL